MSPAAADKTQTPEAQLYEQVRSGHYQLNSAIDSLETASKEAHDLADTLSDAETKKAVLGMRAQIDRAGSLIGDFTDPPPTLEQFSKEFEMQDDERLKAIDAANQSISILAKADSTAEDMLGSSPPQGVEEKLSTIKESIEASKSTIGDAVVALGGKAP